MFVCNKPSMPASVDGVRIWYMSRNGLRRSSTIRVCCVCMPCVRNAAGIELCEPCDTHVAESSRYVAYNAFGNTTLLRVASGVLCPWHAMLGMAIVCLAPSLMQMALHPLPGLSESLPPLRVSAKSTMSERLSLRTPNVFCEEREGAEAKSILLGSRLTAMLNVGDPQCQAPTRMGFASYPLTLVLLFPCAFSLGRRGPQVPT